MATVPKDLDDYLFEPLTEFSTIENTNYFNTLDCVIILSGSKSIPWSKNNRKVYFIFIFHI